jgi:hypothetical protein
MADEEQPPRLVSDLARERAARAAVSVVVEEIALWNEEIARLRAIVKSGRRSRERQNEARLSLNLLTIEITEAEHTLNTQLPLQMQSHSRVADVRRSMVALRHAIGELQAFLDTPLA